MKRTLELLGEFEVKSIADEEKSRQNARRSLVASKHISKGQIITKDDLTFKRPAHGISPKYIDNVIGKTATVDIFEDTVLKEQMIQ